MNLSLQIQLVEEQIADWEAIFEAYKTDFNAAVRLADTKQERCGLCPAFEHTTIEIKDGETHQHLSCRRCPIVRVYGRTCVHWRVDSEFPEKWWRNSQFGATGAFLAMVKLRVVREALLQEQATGRMPVPRHHARAITVPRA